MKITRFVVTTIIYICMTTSTLVFAQEAISSDGTDKALSSSEANKDQETLDAMDKQIKVMSEMHEKLMNAKTANERSALMADHMKVMQTSMAMMTELSKSSDMPMMPNKALHDPMEMDAMGGKGNRMMGMRGKMHHHSNEHCEMMHSRMKMMESIMQMMMDRMNS